MEGQNTEPDYFKALELSLGHTLIELVYNKAVGTPNTIANAAVDDLVNRGLSGDNQESLPLYEQEDTVWAVFDVDEHPDLNRAKIKCRKNGVGVACSNPCFEVWLILHCEMYERPGGRHQAQEKFEALCPNYDRRGTKTIDFSELIDNIEAAENHAERQLQNRIDEGSPEGEPSTTVFELTRIIRQTP